METLLTQAPTMGTEVQTGVKGEDRVLPLVDCSVGEILGVSLTWEAGALECWRR